MSTPPIHQKNALLAAASAWSCIWENCDRFWQLEDRKSTRLNSSHSQISYAVFCLKKKNKHMLQKTRPSRALTAAHGQKPLAQSSSHIGTRSRGDLCIEFRPSTVRQFVTATLSLYT